MQKSKKITLITVSSIIILIVVVILFISPIAKYLVEKYDSKYTGREITLDWAYVNPFTGYIHLSNVNIYEYKSDTIFFSAKGINANFNLSKLWSKTFEISELTLNHPRGIVIQDKKHFNFNDLIEKFSSKDSVVEIKTDTSKVSVKFNILNIKIREGEFHYREKQIPINYFIKNVNVESIGKTWNADTIAVKFSFSSGIGKGDMKGNFTINFKNLEYELAVLIHEFDLQIIEQYLKDLANYGSFTANMDADIKAKGSFKDKENITASGKLVINDFHFGKSHKEDYVSFDRAVLAIQELSPKNHKYLFDSVSLDHPCLKYERYDHLDNIQNMFGKKGENIKAARADDAKFNLVIEIARYVKVLAKNFFQSSYKVDRLSINKADLTFNDFSINEKFSIRLSPLNVVSDSIDKNNNRVDVSLKSGIKPYGNANITLSIDPKNSENFDLQYHFQKIPATLFNPYTITYTSFPLDRGTIELNGLWKVRDGVIISDNHLLIVDPRVTKKLRSKDSKWIPVPLILSFIRDRGNVIDYKIPITGNLKNPKFHLHDIIFDLLENIFVKPATTPYRIEVKNLEKEIEKSLTIKWRTRNSSLLPSQKKFIEKMADFLVDNTNASIDIFPQEYTIKEKEYILFFEAKKKYMMASKKDKSFTEDDSLAVDQMSIKESIFVNYLNKQINDSLVFTAQEKCSRLIDSNIVNRKLKELNDEREQAFISYFVEKKVDNRVKVKKSENVIPFNGFSFYKIKYNGELPESLIKANQEMSELNEDPPRDKFKKERKKYKTIL